MNRPGPLAEFLRHRRGQVRPADVGLPPGIGRRQTPGLRREELATLAGVSVDYYVRLEQGRDTNPGEAVLDALAGALRLDQDERAHLHRLVRHRLVRHRLVRHRPAGPGPAGPGTDLRQLLEAVRPAPAFLLDPASTVLAANPTGTLLLRGLEQWPAPRRNVHRYVFAHPAAREVFVDWPAMARDCVAYLRTVAADPEPAALVAELRAASREFEDLWRDHAVREKTGARRAFRHPAVGRLELASTILTAAGGLRLVVFQAAPGSPDADALTLLELTSETSVDAP